jgi:hypothetical protein
MPAQALLFPSGMRPLPLATLFMALSCALGAGPAEAFPTVRERVATLKQQLENRRTQVINRDPITIAKELGGAIGYEPVALSGSAGVGKVVHRGRARYTLSVEAGFDWVGIVGAWLRGGTRKDKTRSPLVSIEKTEQEAAFAIWGKGTQSHAKGETRFGGVGIGVAGMSEGLHVRLNLPLTFSWKTRELRRLDRGISKMSRAIRMLDRNPTLRTGQADRVLKMIEYANGIVGSDPI